MQMRLNCYRLILRSILTALLLVVALPRAAGAFVPSERKPISEVEETYTGENLSFTPPR
jgi:hypothetical protein